MSQDKKLPVENDAGMKCVGFIDLGSSTDPVEMADKLEALEPEDIGPFSRLVAAMARGLKSGEIQPIMINAGESIAEEE